MKLNKINFEELTLVSPSKLESYGVNENYQFNFLYFLFDDDDIVYVGQSRNYPSSRITAHISSIKVFDRFSILKIGEEYNKELLDSAEAYMIMLHKPKHNHCFPRNNIFVRRKRLCSVLNIHYKTLEVKLRDVKLSNYCLSFKGLTYINAPMLKKALRL